MKKGDFLIIALVAVLLVSVFAFRTQGDTAAIYVDGELYKKAPLSEDAKIVVKSEFGENTVIIKDGVVSIENSDCPGKDCEYGHIKDSSRSLVCLPNRLTVIIESNDKNNETDVVI